MIDRTFSSLVEIYIKFTQTKLVSCGEKNSICTWIIRLAQEDELCCGKKNLLDVRRIFFLYELAFLFHTRKIELPPEACLLRSTVLNFS